MPDVAQGIAPGFSRSKVNKAGDAIRNNTATLEDFVILENWRASHTHVINTFQANLRRRTRDTEFLVGQRLKRRITIEDKLIRQESMALARMHDIAGCRVIFPDLSSMLKFRKEFNNSRFKHRRVTADRDHFNYLENPKSTGYRGIHDVFKYNSYASSAKQWNGLSIEVQFRTRAQHAWSTAVEIADLLTKSRGKFSNENNSYMNFFRVCSELIARNEENSTSCYPEKSDADLLDLYDECRAEMDILGILSRSTSVGLDQLQGVFKKGSNTLLIYPYDKAKSNFVLEAQSIDSTRVALEKYEQAERDWAGKGDVVLVRAQDAATLRKVFQNYFVDSSDFVKYVNRALRKMRAV